MAAAYQSCRQSPQAVDWRQLCLAFDEEIDRTPVGQQLAAAADAIEQMADVFAARADEFFSTWQRQGVAHEGPILDDDLFAEFVRQSFHLDLDGLVGVPEVSRKVKGWCRDIRLDGNYGSHSLRKTWGFWQYKCGTPIPLLMEAFGHQTQRQTMAYLGIQAMEVAQIFELEL
jgi:integrase